MATTQQSTVLDAMLRAEAGDRGGFAVAVRSVRTADLGILQDELNARTRVGKVDPLDAAVALFDIFQARRTAG